MSSKQTRTKSAVHADCLTASSDSNFVAYLVLRLDDLVDQSIQIAKENGYAPFTTTIRAAWVSAINGINESLASFLADKQSGPLGPLATHDYLKDSRFAKMRKIARQHRSLGITLLMYLGLFKHFRNIYIEAARQFEANGLERTNAAAGENNLDETAQRVSDFFDETELSIIADWNVSNTPQRLRELQERTRSLTLEKDRYFAIFESLKNPAFLLDHQRNLVNANEAASELFLGDAGADEIIYMRSMRRDMNTLQTALKDVLDVKLDANQTVWLDTVKGQKYFDTRIRALHDAVENIPLGFVLQLNDVTAHKRAVEKAQEAEKKMSRFLATMSHEIRTPLHSVLGATDMLRTSHVSNHDNYLDVIEMAGQTLLRTLNNVLDYSKLENSPPVPRPTTIDLSQAIGNFKQLSAIGGQVSDNSLSIGVSPELSPTVELDWAMTQQVLANLVANAIRFDKGEGIMLRLSLVYRDEEPGVKTAEKVSRQTGERHPFIRFEVQDHGPGIDKQDAKGLFAPLDAISARNTGNGGNGLGLAISHHLVSAMQGRIGYQNLEIGTIVWFELPYLVAEPFNPEANTFKPANDQDNPKESCARRCLLVDDDPAGRFVTASQLESLGLVVEIASTLQQAREMARDNDYDVHIVDYLLPDGLGPELVQEIRAKRLQSSSGQTSSGQSSSGQSGTSQPRFIALTANAEAIREREDLPCIFDTVLAKPVDKITLEAVLNGSPGALRQPRKAKHSLIKELSTANLFAMVETFEEQWTAFRCLLSGYRGKNFDDDLGLLAHRLAGTTAILEIGELEAPLKALEEACNRRESGAQYHELIAQLDRTLLAFPSWQSFMEELKK